jgi:hypothetical protein
VKTDIEPLMQKQLASAEINAELTAMSASIQSEA